MSQQNLSRQEAEDIFLNLRYLRDDIENAILCGSNNEPPNLIEVGSELGKAILRIDYLEQIVRDKLANLPEGNDDYDLDSPE